MHLNVFWGRGELGLLDGCLLAYGLYLLICFRGLQRQNQLEIALSFLFKLIRQLVLVLDALTDNSLDLLRCRRFKKLTNCLPVDIILFSFDMNVEVNFRQELHFELVELLDTDSSQLCDHSVVIIDVIVVLVSDGH